MTPVLAFMALFAEFEAASWDGWRAIIARLTEVVREFYGIVGRGAGKSRIVALIACYFATREYKRAPGEHIYVGIFAPDRKQSSITFRYVLGLLKSVPALARLIVTETRTSVELSNGVIIEVLTASVAAPRGRAYALAIVEEAAFLPTDENANPDVELLRALRPALARVSGSLLAVVSSPYARRGVLWSAFQKYQAQPDPAVVVVQASTLDLNPTFDRGAIERAYADDPASAAAEHGAEFRSDMESYVSSVALARVVAKGCAERARLPGIDHIAFCDPAGGSGSDSFTLAIAHGEQEDDGRVIAVLDVVREVKPPFSPAAVVAEFAAVLKAYGLDAVSGDRYAGEWPREQFAAHGIGYLVSAKTKAEIYREFLPRLNSAQIELVDHPKLLAQFTGLERRVGFGGHDSIDHAARGHDDLANSASGALLLVHAYADVPEMSLFP